MKKTILQSKEGPITKSGLINAFNNVGLSAGDIVMVHSSIFNLGKLVDIKEKEELCNQFIESLIEVVGKEGAIIFPTFTLSVCKSGIFDPEKTKSEMGILSECARNREDSVRTINPMYSVSIIGKPIERIKKASASTCLGKNSIFDELHKMNNERDYKERVKFMTIGIKEPPNALTFIHYLEEKMKAPYRYYKKFKGKIIQDNIERNYNISFFVRDIEKNVKFNKEACWNLWKEKGIGRSVKFGNSMIYLINEREFHDVICNKILEKPDFLCVNGYKNLNND